MSELDPLLVCLGVAGCAAVAVGAASVAGAAWRIVSRPPDGLLEPLMALVGLIGTASVLTLGLLLLWRVPWGGPDHPPAIGDPLFVASLIGTVGGHLAVLAWARALGAPVALVRTTPRWMFVGVSLGFAGLCASAIWSEAARTFGYPMADQELVATVLDAGPSTGRVATVFFVVAIAPVLEELVFRGYLQTAIGAKLGTGAGIVSVAVLFGLFHVADPAVVPVLTVIGLLLGWVRHKSGSVYPAIAGHLVNNVAAMALALA
ncbi:MAG: CPBP family intramembrane metalloprotease [Pseudomonadota bacterium]|nr:CPBP family intramembrane metalloprotease [Pseudomonadota bacterium]